MSRSAEREQVDHLLVLARVVTNIPEEQTSDFVERITPYLEAFDRWIATRDESLPVESNLRPLLEELQQLHNQIVSRANQHREILSGQLSDVHRRAQGLRAYVDRFPQRITVAGKREG